MEKLLAVSTMSTCGTSLGTSWCWDRAKRNTSYSWEPVGKRPPVGHRNTLLDHFQVDWLTWQLLSHYWAQIQTIHSDFSQGNLCRSALGWLFNEAKVKPSLPTSALTAAFFRPLRWEGNRQKRKYRTDNDRQNHTGLWAQAQWPLCSPAVGKPVRKWQITAWWSPWNFKGHWNSDKLCVCAHAADAQVLQTNRSQKNRYKLKPNQTVCSALPPDSPDADSFAPSFKSIRDLHTRVHADAESFIR